MVDTMAAAGRRGDLPEVVRLAHKLAGSSATVGAEALAQRCNDIEDSLLAKPDAMASMLAAIDAESSRFAAEVAHVLQGGSESGG